MARELVPRPKPRRRARVLASAAESVWVHRTPRDIPDGGVHRVLPDPALNLAFGCFREPGGRPFEFRYPYTGASWPVPWSGVLWGLQAMPIAALVPGHGPVMRDHSYTRLVRELMETVTARVDSAARRTTRRRIRRTGGSRCESWSSGHGEGSGGRADRR